MRNFIDYLKLIGVGILILLIVGAIGVYMIMEVFAGLSR